MKTPAYFKLNSKQIDFIGDIHGYAEKLKMLLYKLGYNDASGYFHHPNRIVVFVGDYIDRGPDNPGVVDMVRKMVDNGAAIALMGNHEYNAVLFNMYGKTNFLRPHTVKNYKQHSATLLQFHNQPERYDDMIQWFKTLPLYIETNAFRAMHACWHPQSIKYLKKHTENGVLTENQFKTSANKRSKLFEVVEHVCKGLEVKLPSGISFRDKDGTERTDIRVKWWENPKGKTYKEMSVVPSIKMERTTFNTTFDYYSPSEVPVFFGHYWLRGTPKLLKPNVCCLDYSVAKEGYLVAYRWNGEKVLSKNNLIYV